jgi:hypothetical protein
MRTIVLTLLVFTVSAVDAQEPPLPSIASRQALVDELKVRVGEWVTKNGDDSDTWVGNRARLEMQLAVARLELATLILHGARDLKNNDDKKRQLKKTLELVQHADVTLYSVDIERLDEIDRRSYSGLSAMRHRATSMQILILLGMVGEGGASRPALGVRFIRGPLVALTEVIPGSPADVAGLQRGDMIRSLDGQQLTSTDGFIQSIAGLDVGASAQFDVERNGVVDSMRIELANWDTVFDTPESTLGWPASIAK